MYVRITRCLNQSPLRLCLQVNRVRFNTQGNKFGVADNDGNLSLWQMTPSAHNGRPFYVSPARSELGVGTRLHRGRTVVHQLWKGGRGRGVTGLLYC